MSAEQERKEKLTADDLFYLHSASQPSTKQNEEMKMNNAGGCFWEGYKIYIISLIYFILLLLHLC